MALLRTLPKLSWLRITGGKVHFLSRDRVRIDTPPDPKTGATHVEMDALEFIHRVTTQIPDARRHLIR